MTNWPGVITLIVLAALSGLVVILAERQDRRDETNTTERQPDEEADHTGRS